jgi:dienelactone hydrolase
MNSGMRSTVLALSALVAATAVAAPPASYLPVDVEHAERPTPVTLAGKAGALAAYLYRPAGDGPFPAVVYNHGSEPKPGVGVLLAPFYVRNGFAVLFVHRRGAGLSEGTFWRTRVEQQPADAQERAKVQSQVEDNDDVIAAFDWLRAQPWVRKDRLFVAGCSFGGIQTLLTAERPVPGLRSANDFAGGAMRWEQSPTEPQRLREAAENARVPVFFVQAENDFSTEPSRVLAEAMRAKHRPHGMKIYPAFGTTAKDGHGFCVRGVDIWAADVLEFMKGAELKRNH